MKAALKCAPRPNKCKSSCAWTEWKSCKSFTKACITQSSVGFFLSFFCLMYCRSFFFFYKEAQIRLLSHGETFREVSATCVQTVIQYSHRHPHTRSHKRAHSRPHAHESYIHTHALKLKRRKKMSSFQWGKKQKNKTAVTINTETAKHLKMG